MRDGEGDVESLAHRDVEGVELAHLDTVPDTDADLEPLPRPLTVPVRDGEADELGHGDCDFVVNSEATTETTAVFDAIVALSPPDVEPVRDGEGDELGQRDAVRDTDVAPESLKSGLWLPERVGDTVPLQLSVSVEFHDGGFDPLDDGHAKLKLAR